MNNYKIRVNNEAESRKAQELFFELGFRWKWTQDKEVLRESTPYLFTLGANIGYGLTLTKFDECVGEELTLPQLHDLAVLHRNDINDANWETEGDDQIYQDSSGKSFIFRKQGWDELQRHEMRQAMWEKIKPKPQTPENKQGLISGADALRALADGEEVEFKHYAHGWVTCLGLNIEQVIHGLFQLRLKPRTIKPEIEIPAPFEPKVGEVFYVLNPTAVGGYSKMHITDQKRMDDYAKLGAWRTEAEIKIVVEQLRKLKEHSK